MIEQQPEAWTCKVRAAGTSDPPQDCDWPFCGCDPYADKVIAALQESGALAARPLPEAYGRDGAYAEAMQRICAVLDPADHRVSTHELAERIIEQLARKRLLVDAVVTRPDDVGGSTVPRVGASRGFPSSPSTEPPAAPLPPAPESDLATVLARMNARFDRLEALIDRPWVGTIDPTGLHHRRTLTLHPVAAPPVTPRSKPGDGV